ASSCLTWLISGVGEAWPMVGSGTTAIMELSVPSLPAQWVATAGRGRPVSSARTSVVRAVQPVSRRTDAAVIRGPNHERTLYALRIRNLLDLPSDATRTPFTVLHRPAGGRAGESPSGCSPADRPAPT